MNLSSMIKRFLLYFISISAFPGFVFWLFYQSDIKSHEHLFESQETSHVNLQYKAITFHFQNIESDLAILSESHELRQLVDDHEDYSSKELENDFLLISLRKGIYDQIRFIDKTGQEMLRVNYNNGKSILVPKDHLQNKAGRYYFKKTMNLNKEKVYVSPLDLNIERGEVEKPFKPMIRFGTPIVNSQDEKKGILILNLMAQFMIDSFKNSGRDSLGQNHLLDFNGYWLSSPNPVDEWGFMLEERKNKAFSNTFPDEWTTILKEENGQFSTHKGLFTFTTLYPVMATQRVKSRLDNTQRVSISRAKANFWKIVSFVPQETLYHALREEAKNLENTLLMLYTFLLLLIGTGTFLFVKVSEQKRKGEVLLNQKASFIQLSQEITITANEAVTAEEAMQICIDNICLFTKWPIGHVYITDSKGTLIPSKIWHIKNMELFKVFWEATKDTSFDPGVGLPGRVMASGKPYWITDVTKVPWFLRTKFAKDVGVKAGFAFPVLEGKKVVAVLEFFANEAVKPDESMLEVLSNLAVQIGRVTERKRSEVSLRESEEKFRSIAQTARDAIITADRKGDIVAWNEGALQIFGYEEEEVLGKSLTMLMPERYREAHLNGLKLATTTGKLKLMGKTIELHGLRKDKSEFPLETSIGAWKTGEEIFYSSIIRDITGRKQTEEKLHKLSRAVEQSPASVIITNAEGNIEYCNPKFYEVTGYSTGEVIGENPRFLSSGEISIEKYKELWDTITSGREWRGEFHNKKKNGELYWELASISAIKNPDGETTHFLAVKEDITRRKQIEEELHRERLNLKKTVETRTLDLQKSIKNLERSNILLKKAKEAQSRFLSSMSHELRTPLNGILGFTDLLGAESFGKLNEEQTVFVEEIEGSSKHLLALINDLLDVAKIDAGAMELLLDWISPDEFIEAALAMLRTQYTKKNISVKTTIDPAVNLISADVRKCKQIMINLLSNAVKYTAHGGRVDVRVKKERDSHVMIEVSDTGIGIKPEDKDKIFSEFHQAESVRDEQLGGTGIGLALTLRLVELHEGEIGVESEPGKGSTFWFTLPLKELEEKETEKVEKKIITENFDFAGHRILIAEDNEINMKMTQKMLSTLGPNVRGAKNGKEAIEIAQGYNPEIILMDMRMPVMDGLEATKQLRAMNEFSDIPIIALTANTGDDFIKEQIAAGCTEHLAKPFEKEKLFKVLKKYLKKKI